MTNRTILVAVTDIFFYTKVRGRLAPARLHAGTDPESQEDVADKLRSTTPLALIVNMNDLVIDPYKALEAVQVAAHAPASHSGLRQPRRSGHVAAGQGTRRHQGGVTKRVFRPDEGPCRRTDSSSAFRAIVRAGREDYRASAMKQSRLQAHHEQLGATFEESTGWSMPAHYGDAAAEYAAVRGRRRADLSHRGRLRVTGDDRIRWLQSIISNDLLLPNPARAAIPAFSPTREKCWAISVCLSRTTRYGSRTSGEVGEATFQALRKFLSTAPKPRWKTAPTPGACCWSKGRNRPRPSRPHLARMSPPPLLHTTSLTIGGQSSAGPAHRRNR